MQTDRHQMICHIIDKSLLGTASLEEEQTLREHLLACTACNDYLAASHRAIAGLGGFSFDVDPGLQQKVMASLARQESETRPFLPVWWSRLIALVLTMAGSLAVSRLAGPAAPVLHVPAAQIQLGLVAFWIVPSVCFFLLFLVLSVSPGKKGLSL
jgi:anti-sigma factor RsiW